MFVSRGSRYETDRIFRGLVLFEKPRTRTVLAACPSAQALASTSCLSAKSYSRLRVDEEEVVVSELVSFKPLWQHPFRDISLSIPSSLLPEQRAAGWTKPSAAREYGLTVLYCKDNDIFAAATVTVCASGKLFLQPCCE